MRSLLGFHPPRFSEENDDDAAWLPGWLQPPSSSSPSGPGGFQEELGSLKQITRENGNFSTDDDRCKSLRLFLSGEDNSRMTFPSSSSNHEVRYHLHLSTEESQFTLNTVLSRYQSERLEALPVYQPEAKVVPEEDTTHKVNCNDDDDDDETNNNIVPSQPKDHESPSFKEKKEKNSKVDDARSSYRVDFVNAIELTIAASEALEIHEIVKQHVPITEYSIGSAVLEAAIRLKQARLEDCIETLSSSSVEEESNEIIIDSCDLLSDLDDLAMADAYEDVGLTVNDQSAAYGSFSHVKDSYDDSENYIVEAKQVEVDSGFINFSKEQHKQVDNANKLLERVYVKETFEGNTHEEHFSDEELGTENVDLACDIDPILSCSVEKADFCMKEVSLERDRIPGDLTPLHTNLRSSIQSEREDIKTNLVPDRFQSRWFGGWTWKNDLCIPSAKDGKLKRHIPEVFANETSSISESADVAPDMNSCMQQKHDNNNKCNSISQTSVTPECAAYEKASSNGGEYYCDDLQAASPIVAVKQSYHDKTTTTTTTTSGNLLSDDVAVFPSSMDPLCSVVPCSFTSNNAGHSQNCEQQLKFEGPTAAPPNLDTTAAIVDVEGSPTVQNRRRVVSLKTYSMLDHHPISFQREQTRVESLPSQQHAPIDFPALMQTPPLGFRDNNNSNDGVNNQTAKAVDTTELTSQMANKKMNLPPMTTTNNGNQPLITNLLSRKVKSTCKSSFLVPRRKRIRFSEPEIIYPQVCSEVRLKDPLAASRAYRGLTSCDKKMMMLFQGLQFLLTGFSVKKHNEIKNLILENGGMVFDNIPSMRCPKLPLILCPKKLLTTKFLYGCAVNACILKVKWLFDSVGQGLILPPKKYMILKEHATSTSCNIIIRKPVRKAYFIFNHIAIMLHGKHNFCSKMAIIIKYGGGLVFKTLHWLVKHLDSKKVSVGAIVVEDENCISRQLKQCALEQNIPTMPFSWIVNSLYAGRLLCSPQLELPENPVHVELSEEI